MVADEGRGDVFLLLSRVLLEGASMDGRGAVGPNLPAEGRLLERVQVEG